jgi:hypothetical protein
VNNLNIPSIFVRATTAANSIAHGVDVAITYNGAENDQSNSFNNVTGIFTAPKNNSYEINFSYWLASATWSSGTYHYAQIEKNGSIFSYCPIVGMPASTMYTGGSCHDIVPMNQGDTLQIKMRQNRGGSVQFDNSPAATRLIIQEKK